MDAQSGSHDEHYVFLGRFFTLQVRMMVHSRHFFLQVRLFGGIIRVMANNAVGSFEKAIAVLRPKHFQELLYIDGLIEDLDD